MDPVDAIVLAAGKSTRIAKVLGGRPKPTLPIQGDPVIVRNLRWLRSQGISNAWINLHHVPEAIRVAVGNGDSLGLAVNYVYEQRLMGTAGTVAGIAAAWNRTFVVVYGDNLLSASLAPMLQTHRCGRAPITIGIFDRQLHPHTGIAGGSVEFDRAGRVTRFLERSARAQTPFVNAGLYLIEPELVTMLPRGKFCDFGIDVFPELLGRGTAIQAHTIDGYCLGLDTPQSYRRALEIVKNREIVLR